MKQKCSIYVPVGTAILNEESRLFYGDYRVLHVIYRQEVRVSPRSQDSDHLVYANAHSSSG